MTNPASDRDLSPLRPRFPGRCERPRDHIAARRAEREAQLEERARAALAARAERFEQLSLELATTAKAAREGPHRQDARPTR